MKSHRFAFPLRRLVSLIGAGLLLLFVGAVVTRGPARRDVPAPVYLSRAAGLAGQTGAVTVLGAGSGNISGPFVTTAQPAASTGNVRQMAHVRPAVQDVRPELKVRESSQAPAVPVPDAALQAPASPSQPSAIMPRPLQDFPGVDFNSLGTGFPPDTNGDVGPNHYVQAVNTGIGIFSKTGTQLAAISLNTLFQNAAPPCNANNNGDPVVLYDAQADRWIVSDFSWTDIDNGPYYECIAASKTGDPTGDWWVYTLRTDDASHTWLSDYPKLGVWPDGIYMSANMFDCSSNCTSSPYMGARVWAISSTQLYSGAALTTVVFDTGSAYFSLLPSNFRGPTPPLGTPNYFVANDLSMSALDVFTFHVDWTNPAHSTFGLAAQVAEASYTSPPETVPTRNGNAVDTLGDRLMMQNQYRDLNGAESLWLAHTADNPTGIRWYQLNVTGGTIATTPVQQGTYAPADGLNRWMPSLAVDKFGDMAVGYSAASASQYPDIRYAGRLVTDPPNILGQDEGILANGTGSPTNLCGGATCQRWGDYAGMSVDPVDDCTFWFTTEYYPDSGSDWQTRISSFRYPACGPVPPPLTVQAYLPLVYTSPNGSWSTVMQENFEGTWPNTLWQASDPGIGDYYWAKSSCHASSGSFSAWAMGGGAQGQHLGCGANYIDNAYSWMVYGPFSLADASAADFTAQLWVNTEIHYDFVCLGASTNNFSTSGGATCYSGSSNGQFVPETLDLSNVATLGSLVGQPQVWIAIVFMSDSSIHYPEGAFVDDLLLGKCVGGQCAAQAAAPGGPLHSQPARLTRSGIVASASPRR